MIKRILGYYKLARKQFFSYFLIGTSGTLLDLLSLAFFKEVLGWKPVTAVVINQILIINYVFFLNKFVTFKAQGKTLKRLGAFVLLSIWNYVFAVAWMYYLNERMGYNYLLVRITGIILAVSWNFLLYKFWVYKPLKD